MNPSRNFCSKLVLILVLFSSLISYSLAQTKVKGFVLDYETQKPVIGATVAMADYASGVLSDSIGLFTLLVSQFPAEIEISHLSYKKQRIIITQDEFLEISLSKQTYNIEEATIEGDLYRRISKEKHLFVTDYWVNDNNIYYLGFENSSRTGILKRRSLSEAKPSSIRIKNPISLKKDYLDNIHLITKDSIYQIYFAQSIHLLYPTPNKAESNELFSFLEPFGSCLIKKEISKNNLTISFIAIDTSNYSSNTFYESFDPGLFKSHEQASRFRMWRYRGEGKMNAESTDVANFMFELYCYDKNVKYRSRNAWLFTKDQMIVILDPNSWELIFMNKDYQTIKSLPIKLERSAQNKLELIKDELTNKIYFCNSNWGKVDIYEIQMKNPGFKHILSLDGYANIQNPQIHDGRLYFLYLTKTYPSVNVLFSRSL